MSAFVAILYIPFSGLMPLLHEEPRRALIARSMMETGEYFVPMLLNEIYTAKPPLYNWLIVAFSWPTGEVTEFTSRLPSAVFLLSIAIMMVVGMRRYLSRPAQVFLGFSILLAPELMAKTSIAEIEIVFTFMVTLSIWGWYWLYDRGYSGFRLWLFPLIVVAISFLTKREPSLVFFYFSVTAFLVFDKRFKELFSIGHIVSFIVMCLIVGGWLSMMVERVGVDALLESLQAQVINRGLTSSVLDYVKHILAYPLELFAALLPFSLLLLTLFGGETRKSIRTHYGKLFVFAALAVLVNFPLYWFRGDAAVRYFLPMFPTILVITALLFEMYYQKTGGEQFAKVAGRTVKVCAVFLMLIASVFLATAAIPLLKSAPPLLLPWYVVLILAVPLMILALKLTRQAYQGSIKPILPVFIMTLVIAKLIYFSAVLPYKLERVSENRNGDIAMREIEKFVPQDAMIQVLGHVHYSLWFYAKPHTLRAPVDFDKQSYSGFVMGYETDPALITMATTDRWQEITRLDYRNQALILGKLNLQNVD